MNNQHNIGWDVGGAHVKAVVLDGQGAVRQVIQRPCPLWLGVGRLKATVEAMLRRLPPAGRHAITMTGELADCFPSRGQGVAAIVATMAEALCGQAVWVFAGKHGLLPLAEVNSGHHLDIASTNWLASARFAAQALGDGLLVDIGSTTTDVVPFTGGQVRCQGFTDYQRLLSQELVYTGVVRTPVMAVARRVVDEGREISLMAECFATMADVYRLTGELDEARDLSPAADGAEKSQAASARRLARMLGCDFLDSQLPRWQHLARQVRGQQLEKIAGACKLLAAAHLGADAPLLGAGVGRFLARELAGPLGRRYVDFTELAPPPPRPGVPDIADCAPAASLAFLLAGHPGGG